MTCETVKLPNGGVAIVCSRGRRKPPPCRVCGHPSSKLCDWPMGGGKSCDAPLCGRCAVDAGPDVDHCPTHRQKELSL